MQQKKEQEAKEEEERKKREVDEYTRRLVPDGYVIIECRKYSVTLLENLDDVISETRLKVMSSVMGGDEAEEALYENPESSRPSPIDFIQVPDWLLKLVPGNQSGVFIQDEVTLVMRQESESREALATIEGDEMFIKISQIYQNSRLSELSRPIEMREVGYTSSVLAQY